MSKQKRDDNWTEAKSAESGGGGRGGGGDDSQGSADFHKANKGKQFLVGGNRPKKANLPPCYS